MLTKVFCFELVDTSQFHRNGKKLMKKIHKRRKFLHLRHAGAIVICNPHCLKYAKWLREKYNVNNNYGGSVSLWKICTNYPKIALSRNFQGGVQKWL
jgi:sorbitol-specific phosphotransferase system component IIC